MRTAPGPDERRARWLLTQLGARPFGHTTSEDTPMTDRPIVPTRILPAGAELPDRPPEPGEVPPWWEPPAAVPPPPPPPIPRAMPAEQPPPLTVHVTVFTEPVPVPEPTRWERLTAGLRRFGRPWQYGAALVLAFVPMPWTGYSAVTTWHYCVTEARAGFGISYGYALAGIPLALAVTALARNGGTLPRLLALAVTTVGFLGAVSWYDPIHVLTGVAR